MLRDRLKDMEYFINYKSYLLDSIKMFKENEARIIENGNTLDDILDKKYFELFSIEYSFGKDIDEIYPYFLKSLGYFTLSYNEGEGIFDIINYMSLAVLFEDRKADFIDDVKALFEKYLTLSENGKVVQDEFIDFLGIYLLEEKAAPFHSDLEYLNMVGDTVESLTQAQKFWYYAHSEASWYNSHTSKNDTYVGYWSFDTAALCKIRGIQGESLKDLEYFPYDLLVQG